MPTESELRDWLKGGDTPPAPGVDPADIVRRVRRRRLPRQIAAGAATTLAAAGVIVLGVATLPQLVQPPVSVMSDGMQSPEFGTGHADESHDSSLVPASPLQLLNQCGQPLTVVQPAASGLTLTLVFPSDVAIADGEVIGTVTLLNSGTKRVTGSAAAGPAITLSRDGVTVWHGAPAPLAEAVPIDLAPGQSTRFDATFIPALCGSTDSSTNSPLAPAAPGDYQLSGAIVISEVGDDNAAGSELVGSSLVPIHLR